MKRLGLIALACALLGAYATPTSAQSKIKVNIQATAKDVIGRQFVFHVRDQIGRSGTFVEDPDGALRVLIVTLDPDSGAASAGSQTIYSYTIVISGGSESLDSYLTSGVGVCGASKVQSCAGSMFTTLGEEVETIRAALSSTKAKNF